MEQTGNQFDEQGFEQNPYDPSGDRARTEQQRKQAMKDIIVGVLFIIVGIAITVVTYRMAEGGGRYVVTWGLMLVGLIQAGKGAFQYWKSGQ